MKLTDGWYEIGAVLDKALIKLADNGRIKLGTKLVICSAELVGSDEACSPLEAPASAALKISANCCRRAKWYARLGYCRTPTPFQISLSSLIRNAGPTASLHLLISRVYPLQFLETTCDNRRIFR